MYWKNYDNIRYAEKIKRLVDCVLESQGDSDTKVRRYVEARAASPSNGRSTNEVDLPEALAAYVDKIARHAYKVTDDDIEALRNAGYSEDAIFELTISAAVGAGIARLEHGIAALRGESNATEKS